MSAKAFPTITDIADEGRAVSIHGVDPRLGEIFELPDYLG
jgi:hypothetical protein